MSDLIKLRRTLQIDGYQFVTATHIDEVALDDESGPAVRIVQNWNYDHDDAPKDDPVEDDEVWLTWAEWAELRDHVDTARQMMPEADRQPAGAHRCHWTYDFSQSEAPSDGHRRCVMEEGHTWNPDDHVTGTGFQFSSKGDDPATFYGVDEPPF